MDSPRLEVKEIVVDDNPAMELVVWHANRHAKLLALVRDFGYRPARESVTHHTLICDTVEDLAAAEEPLYKFFDATGA